MKAFDPYDCGDYSMFRQTAASELTIEEVTRLTTWINNQASWIFEDATLQDALNVYHVSREWLDFEWWLDEEPENAMMAWNSVVSSEVKKFLIDAELECSGDSDA